MGAANWTLPLSAEIGGKKYTLNADYRDILNIITRIQKEQAWFIKRKVLVALFYQEYKEMPDSDYDKAIKYLYGFISCGEINDNRPQPKLIDWEQDYSMIAAEVNRVAHCEVRSVPFLHWFTFIGYFYSVGEGQLSTLVSIRSKKAKGKKLDKWELEYYRDNKKKVDFGTALTAEEEAKKEELNKKLGD